VAVRIGKLYFSNTVSILAVLGSASIHRACNLDFRIALVVPIRNYVYQVTVFRYNIIRVEPDIFQLLRLPQEMYTDNEDTVFNPTAEYLKGKNASETNS
jgi:hypothetical protein